MPLFGVDPDMQAFYSSQGLNDFNNVVIGSHAVERPDLVRIDQDGNVSETATLIVGGKVFEDWESVWIQWSWA